jgi:hypothetical protein
MIPRERNIPLAFDSERKGKGRSRRGREKEGERERGEELELIPWVAQLCKTINSFKVF